MKKTCMAAITILMFSFPMSVSAADVSAMDVSGGDIGVTNENIRPEEKQEENSSSLFDTSNSDLNERFNQLFEDIKRYGFGDEMKLQKQENQGYSMNAVELFKTTYGDLWGQIELETPQLPSNYSASEFLEEGMDMRDSIFANVKSTSVYQDVMGFMNVGSVWGKASQGLPSASSLFNNDYAGSFQKAQNEKNSNQDKQAEIQEGSLKLFTDSGKLLSESSKKSFWSAVDQMKAIMNGGEKE